MNANKEDIGLCNKFRENIHTKEKKVYLLSREEQEKVRQFI